MNKLKENIIINLDQLPDTYYSKDFRLSKK